MNKSMISALVLGAAVVGLATTQQVSAAETATTNPTASDTTDNTQLEAQTKASVFFKGGTLSLYNVQDAAAFNTTDTAFSTQDVWTKGLPATEADKKMTASVDDFLGEDNDTWTLTVADAKWVAGTDGSASGATALDTGAHIKVGDQELTATGVTYATGSEGTKKLDEQALTLAIDKGSLVKKGSYTNTLTWTLADPALPTQD